MRGFDGSFVACLVCNDVSFHFVGQRNALTPSYDYRCNHELPLKFHRDVGILQHPPTH